MELKKKHKKSRHLSEKISTFTYKIYTDILQQKDTVIRSEKY